MKKVVTNVLITLLAVFLTGEIAVRIINPFIEQEKPPPYDTAVKDDLLGWKPKEAYHFVGRIKNEADVEYDVTYSTVRDGFRVFADPANRQTRILFIGDSYTQSVETTDGSVFYDLLGQEFSADVFALGMAGWGSWQQFLALDRWIDSIHPDLIVLQTCSNDFIDNRADLERQSRYKVGLKRPYIGVGGREFHDWPVPLLAKVEKSSRFVAFLRSYWPERLHKTRTAAEDRIAQEGRSFSDYTDAVTVTGLAFRRISDLAGKTPVLAFSADHYFPQYADMQAAALHNGLIWVEGVVDSVRTASQKGSVVHSFDGYHWTAEGQRAVASALKPAILSVLHGK